MSVCMQKLSENKIIKIKCRRNLNQIVILFGHSDVLPISRVTSSVAPWKKHTYTTIPSWI